MTRSQGLYTTLFLLTVFTVAIFGIGVRNHLAISQQQSAIAAIETKAGFQGLILDSAAAVNLIISIIESSEYMNVQSIDVDVPSQQPQRYVFGLKDGYFAMPYIGSTKIESKYFGGRVHTKIAFSSMSTLGICLLGIFAALVVCVATSATNRYQKKMAEARYSVAVKDIAFMMAHDIRSPLAALESIVTRVDFGSQSKSISTLINRMQGVAAELLRIARHGLTDAELKGGMLEQLRSHDLHALLSNVVEEKRLNLNCGNSLHVCCNKEFHYYAEVDPHQFKRIVSNLLDNSLQASTDGGEITLTLGDNKPGVFVEIADQGCGIEPATLTQLGKPGFRSEKKDGTGLGVFHATSTIKRWGGYLKVDSQVGKGTKVRIEFIHGQIVEIKKWDRDRIPDAVLIDDDLWMREEWQEAASSKGLTIWTFPSLEMFLSQGRALQRNTPIFVDRYLADGEMGEQVGETLSALGFHKIYLASGDQHAMFNKSIFCDSVGKNPLECFKKLSI